MDNNEYKPYVPADQNKPEMTVTAVTLGILLSVIFGAANAYLGLRVGMTVSASIPAAVISMGVLRLVLKRSSILENNMVQTIGSAGESLAAGAIFTMPALFLWAQEGIMEAPNLVSILVISLCGGVLGVIFMVPLRNALIVREHKTLPYPEGAACAEVLLAGEKGGTSSKSVFIGMGFAAAVKVIVDGFKAAAAVITIPIEALKTEISINAYPSLIGVGYICGMKVTQNLLAGGVLSWFVLIPTIVFFGKDAVIFPATTTVMEVYQSQGASGIWSNYIRYIGAGAVATAGIISLIKTIPLIIKTFKDSIKSMRQKNEHSTVRTSLDLSMKVIVIAAIVMIVVLCALPQVPVSIVGAVMIIVFGFFFATVSSRMVGLVGSSNNPVSGMTIATLMMATFLLKLIGDTGSHGLQSVMAIASIICISTAMASDMSQDLKTGFLIGATPKKQQIGEIIGSCVAALAIGGVMVLLNSSWGFGSPELPAPQATLMKLISEGIMSGNLPWSLVFIGACASIMIELMGIPSMTVAIGMYLPLDTSMTMMIGGLIRYIVEKIKTKRDEKVSDNGGGILFCSGMIAGEGLIGILLAGLAVGGIDKVIDISGVFSTGAVGGIVLIVLISFFIFKSEKIKENKN